MKKKLILINSILLSIIVIFFIINNILYALKIYVKNTPDTYSQKNNTKYNKYKEYTTFFNNFKEYTIIPGLNEGGIPQGICYSKKIQYFINI